MSEQANNPKRECKCDGSKKIKALEKKVEGAYALILALTKEIATLRRAVRK